MYYHFDVLSLLIFAGSCIVLWIKRDSLPRHSRGLYSMIALTFVYLIGSLFLSYRWHVQTGEMFLKSFYDMDVMYFATISLMPSILMVYFVSMCVKKARFVWAIFLPSILQVLNILFVNPRTGAIFYYVGDVYHRGPYLWTSYALWGVYMVAILSIVYNFRGKLGRGSLLAYALFFVYEIGVQVYQTLVKEAYIGGGFGFSTGLFFLVMAPLILSPHRDEVTGLFNRSGFPLAVTDMLRRMGDDRKCSMIAIDIQNFKGINERFGFRNGDRLLKYVGTYLEKILPKEAELARFDTDRFFVCVEGKSLELPIPDIDIRQCLPNIVEPYTVSFNEGVYQIMQKDDDVALMCDKAIMALKKAKGDHHTKCGFFDDELAAQMSRQSHIVQEMNRALAEEEFTVYYQPIYEVDSGKPVGGEALVRWKDKKYGDLSPGEFIPLFEDNGFISEMDIYVCEKVCKQIKEWKEQGLKPCPISLNISGVDLGTPGFLRKFVSIPGKYDLMPDNVRVEITESAFVKTEEFRNSLNTLHSMKYRVFMDDFGSGYSNLNTFAGMPVDLLKADIGFMDTMIRTSRGAKVMESIADMAKKLEMPIVAEGVETKYQLEYLKATGIEFAQGFYLARPMAAEDFGKLLEAKS